MRHEKLVLVLRLEERWSPCSLTPTHTLTHSLSPSLPPSLPPSIQWRHAGRGADLRHEKLVLVLRLEEQLRLHERRLLLVHPP